MRKDLAELMQHAQLLPGDQKEILEDMVLRLTPLVPKLNKGVYSKANDRLFCSRCGFSVDNVVYKYCPNCGQMQWKDSSPCITNYAIREGILKEGEYEVEDDI